MLVPTKATSSVGLVFVSYKVEVVLAGIVFLGNGAEVGICMHPVAVAQLNIVCALGSVYRNKTYHV